MSEKEEKSYDDYAVVENNSSDKEFVNLATFEVNFDKVMDWRDLVSLFKFLGVTVTLTPEQYRDLPIRVKNLLE